MVPAQEFLLAFKNLMNEEKKNVERHSMSTDGMIRSFLI